MDKGRIIQNGTPAELLFNPVNGFVKDFLKEQRLQLEFRAIRLADIWPHLTPQPPKGGAFETHDGLNGYTSFWSAIESFKFIKSEAIRITNQENEAKSVGFEQLMAAFYQYKKTANP